MGSGSWTRASFVNYTMDKGLVFDEINNLTSAKSVQDNFKARDITSDLNPLNVMRECRDTEEHPNTKPVILALDVTGSMGSAATEIARSLNRVMEEIMSKDKDVEFCIMGIGDLYCDYAPIQISQFESDIRIAEHMDKVFFEFGGGGNSYESYTAAWYMGARHTDLDCWKRGKKGIIITIGDETINPYLPKDTLQLATGDSLQANVETDELYKEASEKFDIYHIFADHSNYTERYGTAEKSGFGKILPQGHFSVQKIDEIPSRIIEIVTSVGHSEGISW